MFSSMAHLVVWMEAVTTMLHHVYCKFFNGVIGLHIQVPYHLVVAPVAHYLDGVGLNIQ